MQIKLHRLILGLSLAAVLVTTPSCTTVTPGSPGTFDRDKVTKTAIILKNLSRSVVFYASAKDTNAASYATLAISVMDKFIQQTNLSPPSLTLAMREVQIRELKSVEAQIAVNTIEMTYEIFWSDMVKAKVQSNEPLMIVLLGVRDGLLLGKQDIAEVKVVVSP